MGNLQNILKLVPTLTRDELQQLQASIKVTLALTPASGGGARVLNTDINNDDHHLLVMVSEYMRRRGVDFMSPNVLMQDSGFGAFKRKVPSVMEFMHKLGGKHEQNMAITMALDLLYHDLTMNLNRAATSKLMMAHIHRLPAMLNRAFPGYAQSGMLKLIMKGK